MAIIVFDQNIKIRELKKIHNKYELITKKFEQLKTNYESNLLKYKKIKVNLDQSKTALDSITLELNKYTNNNADHIAAIEIEISNIIRTIDTTQLITKPIVNLDSLYTNEIPSPSPIINSNHVLFKRY